MQCCGLGRCTWVLTQLLATLQIRVDQGADCGGSVGKVNVRRLDALAIEVFCEARHLQVHHSAPIETAWQKRNMHAKDQIPASLVVSYTLPKVHLHEIISQQKNTQQFGSRHLSTHTPQNTCVDLPERSRPSSTINAPLLAIFWKGFVALAPFLCVYLQLD